MKICLINSLYYPDTRGGAEQVTQTTAELLRDAGHEVLVITTSREAAKVEDVNGVKVFRVASHNICSFYECANKPLWYRLLWFAIDLMNRSVAHSVRTILTQEQPDVVHVHNMRGLSYQLSGVIRNANTRYIQTLHDIQYRYPSGVLIKGQEQSVVNTFFLRRWYESYCKKKLGSPDVVISPSQWLLDFYTEKGFFKNPEKEVVRNPISVTSNKQSVTKNKKTINLLYVGQIEEHKGVLFFLDSIKDSLAASDRLLVTVIGSGSQVQEVKLIAEQNDHITFHGQLNQTELQEHYQNADLLIMPTMTYENLPTVILEAFANGVPVVASNLGGISELVQENRTGWLFEAGDGYSFAKALEKGVQTTQNPGVLKAIQQNCLAEVQKSRPDTYLQALEALYST